MATAWNNWQSGLKKRQPWCRKFSLFTADHADSFHLKMYQFCFPSALKETTFELISNLKTNSLFSLHSKGFYPRDIQQRFSSAENRHHWCHKYVRLSSGNPEKNWKEIQVSSRRKSKEQLEGNPEKDQKEIQEKDKREIKKRKSKKGSEEIQRRIREKCRKRKSRKTRSALVLGRWAGGHWGLFSPVQLLLRDRPAPKYCRRGRHPLKYTNTHAIQL